MNIFFNNTKNKGMESLYLLIPLFFVLIVIIPLKFKIKIKYDVFENYGFVRFNFYFIKFPVICFKFQQKALLIKTNKNKKRIKYEIPSKELRFYEQFLSQIKDKIRVEKLFITGRVGAFSADKNAIIVGFLNIFVCSFLCALKANKEFAKNLHANFIPVYNENVAKFGANGKVSICFFDIVYAVIMSFIIIKRSEKYAS